MTRIPLRKRAQEFWQKLAHLDARPDQIAAGFSIGVVAGLVPLNPSPIIVATVVAWLLKRNVIAAIAGAAMAILYTPLLPLLWWAEYRLGKLILPVRHPLNLDRLRLWDVLHAGWDAYAAMFVGSLIIAAPVAVATYWIVKPLAQRRRRQKSESRRSA